MKPELQDFVEKLEDEYGYLPGAFSTKNVDMRTLTDKELKLLIETEFPKWCSGSQLNESWEIEELMNELDAL